MVNPNPRKRRHLAETETIAKMEMISQRQKPHDLGLGFSLVTSEDLGDEGAGQGEKPMRS
jgi:hypothetical protein